VRAVEPVHDVAPTQVDGSQVLKEAAQGSISVELQTVGERIQLLPISPGVLDLYRVVISCLRERRS
jgi:hypothetical protein